MGRHFVNFSKYINVVRVKFNPLKRQQVIAWLKNILGTPTYMKWRNRWLFGDEEDPVMLQELPTVSLDWPPLSSQANGPVILISPTQRSGSNFIYQLLCLHPGLKSLADQDGLPQEFFFHTYSEALKAYAENTVPAWSTWLKDPSSREKMAHRLMAGMGQGMLSELGGGNLNSSWLFRAPDARGIENIFHLFPTARVLLLYRDGRDTCTSFMNSWGGESVLTDFAHRWNSRVQEMIQFQQKANDSGYGDRVLEIHYEEFVSDPVQMIKSILPKLGLSSDEYPYDKVGKVPLLGTSEARVVHWEPEQKPSDFNPIGRWKTWSPKQQKDFMSIAGPSLRQIGYDD